MGAASAAINPTSPWQQSPQTHSPSNAHAAAPAPDPTPPSARTPPPTKCSATTATSPAPSPHVRRILVTTSQGGTFLQRVRKPGSSRNRTPVPKPRKRTCLRRPSTGSQSTPTFPGSRCPAKISSASPFPPRNMRFILLIRWFHTVGR